MVHNTGDPIGATRMRANSYDSVRLPKFGHLDTYEDLQKPVNERPSYHAMNLFIADLPEMRQAKAEKLGAKFDAAGAVAVPDFDDDEDDPKYDNLLDSIVPAENVGAGFFTEEVPFKPIEFNKAWLDLLERDPKSDAILKTDNNIRLILSFDSRFYGKLAHNAQAQHTYVRRTIKLHSGDIIPRASRHEMISDLAVQQIKSVLTDPQGGDTKGYGMSFIETQRVRDALDIIAYRNKVYPHREWLWKMRRTGQGYEPGSLDTWLIDYCGADDNLYIREISRLIFMAIIDRDFRLGNKWDYVPVLQGPQGLRKSAIASTLAGGDQFFGIISDDISDERSVMEKVEGRAVIELDELSSGRKSEQEAFKSFITRKVDEARPAYGRACKTLPRSYIMIATTNPDKYGMDETGNRRFWPIPLKGVDRGDGYFQIDLEGLRAAMPSLMAEAFDLYEAFYESHFGTREFVEFGDLPLYIDEMSEAGQIAAKSQSEIEKDRLRDDYLEALDLALNHGLRESIFQNIMVGEKPGYGDRGDNWVRPTMVTPSMAAAIVRDYGHGNVNQGELRKALDKPEGFVPLADYKGRPGKSQFLKIGGKSYKPLVRADADYNDIKHGYVILDEQTMEPADKVSLDLTNLSHDDLI